MTVDAVSLPWLTSQAEKILPYLSSLAPSPVFPRPAIAIPLPSVGETPRHLTRLQVHRTPPRQLLRALAAQSWSADARGVLLLYNLDSAGHLSDAVSATPFWLGYAFAPDEGEGELCARMMFNATTNTIKHNPQRTTFEAKAGGTDA